MRTFAFIITGTLLTILNLGCGGSDSGERPSMDQLATAAREQRAATAAASVGGEVGSAAEAAAAPSAGAPSSPPAAARAARDANVAAKRGFDLEDWSNEAAYILVKTDADQLAETLAKHWPSFNGTSGTAAVHKNVLGKTVEEESYSTIVFQLAGHPWSIFACHNRQLETLVPALSRDTAADLIVFWNSDFNGWAGVELYRAGEEVEALHWGLAEDGLGEDADPSRWHSRGEVTEHYEDIPLTTAYLFRSKVRKLSEQQLQQGDTAVDAFLRHHDAYLPDLDDMPWGDYETDAISARLPASAFAAVHEVRSAAN